MSIWHFTSFSNRQKRKAECFVLKWLLNCVLLLMTVHQQVLDPFKRLLSSHLAPLGSCWCLDSTMSSIPTLRSVQISHGRNKHWADFNVWELCFIFMITFYQNSEGNRNWWNFMKYFKLEKKNTHKLSSLVILQVLSMNRLIDIF